MSSTNRNYERQDQDYYVTPGWAIDQLLPALMEDADELFGWNFRGCPLVIIDPCAGGDAGHPMAYPSALRRCVDLQIEKLVTVDIRPDSLAEIKENFLTYNTQQKFDIAISNPPSNLAMQFIQKSLDLVSEKGLVVMLQRLNFLGSKERQPMFALPPPNGVGMPTAIYVHSKRMRFMQGINPANGKPWPGDSIEYGHFVWQKGNNPKFAKLRVLPYMKE